MLFFPTCLKSGLSWRMIRAFPVLPLACSATIKREPKMRGRLDPRLHGDDEGVCALRLLSCQSFGWLARTGCVTLCRHPSEGWDLYGQCATSPREMPACPRAVYPERLAWPASRRSGMTKMDGQRGASVKGHTEKRAALAMESSFIAGLQHAGTEDRNAHFRRSASTGSPHFKGRWHSFHPAPML